MKNLLLIVALFFLSYQSFAQFPDSISTSGLPSTDGIILEVVDYNNDGFEDLVYQNGLSGSIDIYRNVSGKFTKMNTSMSWPLINGAGDGSEGVFSFDYNGDGFQDLLIARSGASGYFRLFRNDCGVAFSEVTAFSLFPALVNITGQHLTLDPMIRIFDYDRDDDNDIVFGEVGNTSNSVSVLQNVNGNFQPATALVSGLPTSTLPWFVSFDVDNDQDEDLLLMRNTGVSNPCTIELYQNGGSGSYSLVSGTGFTTSSPVGFANVLDYNRDGFLDVLLGTKEVVAPGPGNLGVKVFRNTGSLTFADATSSFNTYTATDAGDFFNSNVFDLNNDGDLDVLWEINRNAQGTSRVAVMNNNGLNTFNNTRASTLPSALTTTGYSSHYVVFDYDNDGLLDVFKPGSTTQPASLYRNNSSTINRYLDIKLQTCSGQGEPRGAMVLVKAGALRLFEPYSSQGISSATTGKSEYLHFGVGTNLTVDSVVVIWPNGTVEVWRNVSTNQKMVITNGTCVLGDLLSLDLGSDSISVCNQDTAYLNAPGGFVTYAWSNGDATPTAAVTQTGWYFCTVTNLQGCSASDSVYISFGRSIIAQNDTTICLGTQLTLRGYPRYDCSPFGAPAKRKVKEGDLIPGMTYVASLNGHHYYRMNVSSNWSQAEQAAIANGGHLAIINSADENNFLTQQPSLMNDNLWIGLYRGSVPSDPFVWVNCDPVNYTNWGLGVGAPSTMPTEQYVYLRGMGCPEGGMWKNTDENMIMPDPCESNFFGLVEFDEAYDIHYQWSTNDTTSNISVKPSTSVNYVLWVTQSNATCFSSVNITVVNPNNLIAADSVTDCKATSIRVDAVPGMVSYAWSNGSTDSFTVVPLAGANRWIKLTSLTPSGCIGSDSIYVGLVNSTILTPDTSVCLGDNITVRGPVAASYLWSTGATTRNINVTPGPGVNNYWVRVPVGNKFCYDTVAVTANSGKLPGSLFASDTVAICNANSTILSLPSGYSGYRWSNGAAIRSTTIYNEGWVRGFVITLAGCYNFDSVYVAKTKVSLIPVKDTQVCNGKPVPVSANINKGCNPFGSPVNVGYTPGSPVPGYTYVGNFRGHHYYVADNRSSWTVAAQDALNNGGNLAVVNDTAEENFIAERIPNPVWLGLYRDPSKGYFHWMNCDTMVYTNWGTGMPGPDDYVYLYSGACVDDKKWLTRADDDMTPPDPCISTGIYGLLEMEPVNYIYQWSNGSSTPSTSVTVVRDTTVTLTLIKDYNGHLIQCNSNTLTIRQLPSPSVPVITGKDTVCAQTAATYTTTGTSGHTYRWTVTGGTITSGQGTASINVNWTVAGTGTVKVVDSLNASGCTAESAIKTVVKLANPTPAISGPNNLCAGTSASYLATRAAGHTYTWTIAGGIINSGQGTDSINVTWGTAGGGNLRVLDSVNATGCKAYSLFFVVTKNAVPAPVISGPDKVCTGNTATYSTTTTAGHTYTWVVNGGSIVSGQGTSSISVLWPTAGPGDVMVTDSVNTTGCKAFTPLFSVTITDQPMPVVSGKQNVCANTNAVYNITFATGHTYKWTVSGGSIFAGQGTSNIIVTWGAAGAGTVWVSDSADGTGCKGNSPILNVVIDNIPNPSVTGSAQVCAGSSAGYTTPSTSGHYYDWTANGGVILSGQGTTTIQVLWPTSGFGDVQVRDSAILSGCAGTSTVFNVTVSTNPSPSISGPVQVCEYQSAFYSSTSTTGNLFTWSVTGGMILSGQGTSTIEVLWNTAGSGALSVTDSNTTTGCFGIAGPYNVAINQLPAPTISGPVSLCGTDPVAYQVAWNSGRSYNWTVVGGTILTGQGTEIITVQWPASGTGTVSVLDSNLSTGCFGNSFPLNVTITAPPSPILSGAIEACLNTTSSYGTVPDAAHYFDWSVTGGVIVSGQGTERIYVNWLVPGQGIISIKDSLINSGCVGYAYRLVDVHELPTAHFTLFQSGGAVTLTPTQTGNSYMWYFGDGDSSSAPVPTHFYAANGIFTVALHARNIFGCTADSSMLLDMQLSGLGSQIGGGNQLEVYPNPFSDRTQIVLTLKQKSEVSLEVFDMTGRRVKRFAESTSYDAGTVNFTFDATESHAADGVYLVRLQVGDEVTYRRIVEAGQ